jgi:Response regulator of the LytR/AlgR family
MRDVWQRLVTNGVVSGTTITARQTFFYTAAAGAVIAASFSVLTILSQMHFHPGDSLERPVVLESSSWLAMLLFLWAPWTGYRLAPLGCGWRLLLHIPFAMLYCLGHVGSFVLLRHAAHLVGAGPYAFGPLWHNLGYEAGMDALVYTLYLAGFTFVAAITRHARPPEPVAPPAYFDIRDGAKRTRVLLDDIFAVSSAGNYAEFVLRDGRRLCMRTTLSALERELAPLGFLRSHRSWLINVQHVTALSPAGSGDYAVSLGALSVPLSRRFPDALARLRAD